MHKCKGSISRIEKFPIGGNHGKTDMVKYSTF
nr:MAG TPA: hypothetical protein [Caudoviricetes sp.]